MKIFSKRLQGWMHTSVTAVKGIKMYTFKQCMGCELQLNKVVRKKKKTTLKKNMCEFPSWHSENKSD